MIRSICFSLLLIVGLAFAEAQNLELPDSLLQVEKQFSYGYQLTDSFLYCYLEFPAGDLQSQILITGLTLWLEPGGKKKARKGLLYPLGLPEQQVPRKPIEFVRFVDEMSFASRQRLASPPEMLVIGYYGGREDDVITAPANTKGALGIYTQLNQQNILRYRVRIPLSALDDKSTFRWGWETGKLPRPELRGTDAVGIDSGINSTPETRSERNQARYLDTYRLYGDESKWRSGKINLPSGE
ncbi:MAG: hypothetical protein AAFN10_15775 [Bacteroidota bacterium]